MSTFLSKLRPWSKREDGASTVEFCLVFPAFIMMFVAAFEVGLANVRMVMVERASDLAVRALRLDTGPPPTYADLRAAVCNVAGIIPDCMNTVKIELQPVSTVTWTPLDPNPDCRDRAQPIDPANELDLVNAGQQNDLMLIRICAVVDPMFPTFGFGAIMPKDNSGGYRLVATTAYVNEPD